MSGELFIEEIQGPGTRRWSRFFRTLAVLFGAALLFHLFYDRWRQEVLVTAWTTGLVICVLLATFTSVTMKTRLCADGIYVRYAPFMPGFVRFPWEDIASISIRKYNALSDYNGWG